jgi:hypothetical protein
MAVSEHQETVENLMSRVRNRRPSHGYFLPEEIVKKHGGDRNCNKCESFVFRKINAPCNGQR